VFIAILLQRTCWKLVSAVDVDSGGLERSSTGHQIEDEHDDGEDQQNVNPSAQCVTADESYDPEDEKDNGDCPKHFSFS
jgi:hypothetical protein